MWILVVEDNENLLTALEIGLGEAGHTVETVTNGIQGEAKAISHDFDLLIVDIGLPGKDGISLVRSIRAAGITTPVLMLTGQSDIDSRVLGLDAGADDYVVKPFSFEELLARVRALHRRVHSTDFIEDVIKVGNVWVDTRQRSAGSTSGEEFQLRLKEYSLLELLARNPNSTVTRTVIAERVWGHVLGVTSDVINMTVSSLRKKMEDGQGGESGERVEIRTVRGVGYMLTVPV